MVIHYDPGLLFADHFQYQGSKSELDREIEDIKEKEEELEKEKEEME